MNKVQVFPNGKFEAKYKFFDDFDTNIFELMIQTEIRQRLNWRELWILPQEWMLKFQ